MTARECFTCVHSHFAGQTPDDLEGVTGLECRRYPPQIFIDVANDTTNAAFPPVSTDDFCGEWEEEDLDP